MGKIDDMMKPKDIEEETWDSELPAQLGFTLTEGKHEIKITAIELVNTRFADEKTGMAKKALRITGILTGTEKEASFNTGARNVWDYLRQNKPAINKTFTFTITGEGKNRRFKDMELV